MVTKADKARQTPEPEQECYVVLLCDRSRHVGAQVSSLRFIQRTRRVRGPDGGPRLHRLLSSSQRGGGGQRAAEESQNAAGSLRRPRGEEQGCSGEVPRRREPRHQGEGRPPWSGAHPLRRLGEKGSLCGLLVVHHHP